MEKRKPWQLSIILVVIALTIYNILPTIFYYSKPLNQPITEERANVLSKQIANRVNQLEEGSVDWLYSFCKLLHISPKSIEIDKNDIQKISLEFSSANDAETFSKYLPMAGNLISFVPSQLRLGNINEVTPTKVSVFRNISIHIPEEGNAFVFAEKFDKKGTPSTFYKNLVFDQVTQMGLTVAGPSENYQLIALAQSTQDASLQKELITRLAQNIVTTAEVFGSKSPITKRFYASFTQGNKVDKSQTVSSLIKSFQSVRDQLKLEKIQLEKSTQISSLDKERQKKLIEKNEELFVKAEKILNDNKSSFGNGKTPFTSAYLNNLLNQTYEGQYQNIEINKNNPFISSIQIDWEKEKIFIKLHSDILLFEKGLKEKSKEKSQYSQLIINEIARISRLSDETIAPSEKEYVVDLSVISDGKSFLSLDLGKIALLEKENVTKAIQNHFTPSHSDFAIENFPIFDYANYKNLPLIEKSTGLVVYAPSTSNEEVLRGMKTDSIYIIAKGINRIYEKYQKDPQSQEAKKFIEDFSNLKNILQEKGYIVYPGSMLPFSGEFSNDFIFEKPNYYKNLLNATREDFKAKGTKRFATLELSTYEQRLLTLNKIETKMHEELIRSHDEYHTAQVSPNPHKKFEVPEPSKGVLSSNFALSLKKYFRGDERKILHWGLDLSGGKAVQIELRDQSGKLVTDELELKEGINELYNRVNKMGVSEVSIRQEGNTVALDFPGSQSISAQELIKSSSMFFHVVNEKFSTNNPSMREHINRFLQEVWNEAVVMNRKDCESINQIAFKHLYGDSLDSQSPEPRSAAAQVLYDNGLRLKSPDERQKSTEFNDEISMIALLRDDENRQSLSYAHPLYVVFKNHALEGANLQNVNIHYDPAKGNSLNFSVKNSFNEKLEKNISPQETLHSWTSKFARDQVGGSDYSNFSNGKGWRMAVVLNDSVISAPELHSALKDSASITGNFSQREASRLSADLKAGSLTYTPKILSEKNISPELGTKDKTQGILAMLIALVLVIACMTFYYRLSGLIASIAVIFNLLILWGALQNIEATLSLAGIAGIILTVGMAVDANVLVFERIREEFEKSNKLGSAIKIGYKKAFGAIFDSNITTLLCGVILLNFDSGPIKGFALTLIIGIVSSMFTALFMTKYIFSYWLEKTKSTRLNMKNFTRGTNINFLKISKKIIAFSLLLIVVGNLTLLVQRKSIFGMDFSGGYALNIQIDSDKEDLRHETQLALTKTGASLQDIQVRQLDSPNNLKIFLSSVLEQEGKAFHNLPLSTKLENSNYSYESNPRISWIISALEKEGLHPTEKSKQQLTANWTAVSGQMSDTMKYNAIWGLSLALVAILGYITFRYEFKYAFSAMICLIHDVLIALGIIAMLHLFKVPVQIDLNTVAALMLIVGYSLNDTIVIFDRIREDLNLNKKTTLPDIINNAINTTLSRTLITSFTTFIVLLSLIVFGGSSIFGFSLVMALGVVFGTLSSIFIASPIMLYLHKYQNKKKILIPASK